MGVAIQIAHHAHGNPGINRLLQLFGQVDAFHRKVVQAQAVTLEAGRHLGAHLVSQQHLIGGHIEERHFRAPQGRPHGRHDQVAQLLLQLIDGVFRPGAADLGKETARIRQLVRIHPEGAQPHHAEILIAQSDGLGRSPFAPQLKTGAEEIHIRLERRLKQLVPILQIRQHRNGLGIQGVAPGAEHIGNLALIHKHRHLGIPHRQAGPVLDLEILHRITPGQHAVLLLVPLEDINKLLLDKRTETHGGTPIQGGGEEQKRAGCALRTCTPR